MPDIWHIINFISIIVGLFVGWKKLKPKDHSTEIKELQVQVRDLEKSIDKIEVSVDRIRNFLMERNNDNRK